MLLNLEQPSAAIKQCKNEEKPNAKVAEVRREEWLNDDIKKKSEKQYNEKMKPFLCEPLRSLRLCVEKDAKIMHNEKKIAKKS